MNKYFLVGVLILFSVVLRAQNKTNSLKNNIKGQKTAENISVRMFATGDLQGEYNFSGSLGSQIPGSSAGADSACLFSSLFRKLKYRNKKSIEAWLTLECTFEGQKNMQKTTYKPHRIYLEIKDTVQKIRLPILAKNLKNVRLEFQYVSIK